MILTIDGNNLFYRFCSYMAQRNDHFLAKTGDDAALMGAVMSNINSTVRNMGLRPEAIYFTADSAHNFRQTLPYPDMNYKGTRTYSDLFDHDVLKATIQLFGERMRDFNGWCFSKIDGFEGDDLLCLISKHYLAHGKSSIIISSDGDTRQLASWNGKNYIAIFDTQAAKMNKYVHLDFGKYPDDEFGGLFDDSNTTELSFISTNAHIRVNPVELAFVKIMGGDSGDNVPSVYIKQVGKDKHLSFGPGYSKSLWNKKSYPADIINQLRTSEDMRRRIASDALQHMKSHELGRIGEVADNILRNIRYMFLDEMVYDGNQIAVVEEHIHNHKLMPTNIYTSYLDRLFDNERPAPAISIEL